MNANQIQAFLDGAGIHAGSLNFLLRLTAGLLITVVGVFVLIGLIKLLEDGHIQSQFRFILYLMTLAMVIMLFYSFVVA